MDILGMLASIRGRDVQVYVEHQVDEPTGAMVEATGDMPQGENEAKLGDSICTIKEVAIYKPKTRIKRVAVKKVGGKRPAIFRKGKDIDDKKKGYFTGYSQHKGCLIMYCSKHKGCLIMCYSKHQGYFMGL